MSQDLSNPIPQDPIDKVVLTTMEMLFTDDGIFDGIRSEVQFGRVEDGVFVPYITKPSQFTRATALAALSQEEKDALASIRQKIIDFERNQI